MSTKDGKLDYRCVYGNNTLNDIFIIKGNSLNE